MIVGTAGWCYLVMADRNDFKCKIQHMKFVERMELKDINM